MSARSRARHTLAALAVLAVAAVGLAHDAAAASPSTPSVSCPPAASLDGTAAALAAEHGVQLVAAAVLPPAHDIAHQADPADYVVALTGTDGRTSVWGLAYLDPQWVDTAYPVGDVARALDPGAAHLWLPASSVHDHTLVAGLAAACAEQAGGAA